MYIDFYFSKTIASFIFAAKFIETLTYEHQKLTLRCSQENICGKIGLILKIKNSFY